MGSNNLALLNSIIAEYSTVISDENISKDKIFEYFAVESYFNKYDFSFDEVQSGLVGNKKDWGIDGFYIIIDENIITNIEDLNAIVLKRNFEIKVVIFQFKNSETFDENVINKFIVASQYILDIDLMSKKEITFISPDIVEKISLFHEIITKNAMKFPYISLTFVHASRGDSSLVNGERKFNGAYNQKVKQLESSIHTYSLGGKTSFDYLLLGAEELKNLAQYQKSYSGQLKLSENPIFVEYGSEEQKKGYIATAYLQDYYDFLVEYDEKTPHLREYLFEANIRDYQNKTEVNKDIEKTLNSSTKENDFWWLNNGITILADSGSLTGKTFSLENIQVVNGLQTSHSIFHCFKDGSSKDDFRTIFCKIIITEDINARDSIIKATNFQNAVPASSLRSTDSIQRDIEMYLIGKGYFYDRRKNYYKNQKKPRNKIVSINYLAQALTAILQRNPSKARTNPTVLTKLDSDYSKIFNKHISIEVYYNVLLIRNLTEATLKKFQQASPLEEDIISYFKLHITRIIASILTNDPKPSQIEISKLNIDEIYKIEKNCDKALEFLTKLLRDNFISKGDNNLANISKSQEITTLINSKVADILKV